VSGTNVINVAGVTSIGVGPYNLITAASGLSGTYNFGGSGTTTQTVAVGTNAYDLTLSSSATAVTVTVGAPTAIASGVTWTGKTNGTGANNSNWDNAISNNWAANTTASAVSNGTAVTFGDTNASDSNAAIGNSTVNVAASGVTPTSTTFNNSSVNYIVGGGAIGGTGGLTKSGSGSLTLSSINTYTGATNVDAGTLNVSSTGNINSTASINVAAGATVRYNSSTALTVAPTLAGNGSSNRAVLSGAGSIGVAITLDNLGDVLSPGNSPGIQTYTTAQSWSSFTYDWEVNDFTGLDAGTAFDQLGLTTLNLSGGSGSYVLNVLGLTAGNTTGLVPNFSEINRSWTILTTSGGISNFNAASWSINTTGFSDPDTGNWSLAQNGNDLVLSYNVIPEPHVSLLGGLGVLLLLGRRRRH
jgi:autotransporter-associated beta strand protein